MDQLITAYISAWKRSFEYEGRTSRSDYWWFELANFIVLFVLNLLGSFNSFIGVLANLYLLAHFVPQVPLTVRRLRDSGKPWPWYFILFIPAIGAIWLIVLLCQPSVSALA
jgi:uncharacterized membrane protein YhaH (DUF805 family)